MPNWIKNVISIESPSVECISEIKKFFGELNFNSIIPTNETLNIEKSIYSDAAYTIYMSYLYNNDMSNLPKDIKRYFDELPYIKDPSYPESIFGLTSEDISYLYKSVEDNEIGLKSPKCKGDLFILGRIQYINMLKYGARDWYNFNKKKWGTKWSACYNWEDETNNWCKEYKNYITNTVIYEFRTAWSMPYGIINEFLFNFGYRKDLKLTIKFADENIGYNLGYYTKDYNDMVLNFLQLNCVDIDNPKKFACTLWGFDYNEFIED